MRGSLEEEGGGGFGMKRRMEVFAAAFKVMSLESAICGGDSGFADGGTVGTT